mmetsp:Transcript_103117/g.330629  ORF Transcript_103117/g.330629 Transcript_103117/m.330629 type:complete len:85 (+) Transcript_103117:455-709(+)
MAACPPCSGLLAIAYTEKTETPGSFDSRFLSNEFPTWQLMKLQSILLPSIGFLVMPVLRSNVEAHERFCLQQRCEAVQGKRKMG